MRLLDLFFFFFFFSFFFGLMISLGDIRVDYVPCDTLMNITIKFDSLPPIPLHPLDLSNHIDNNPNINPTTCLGTLQYSPQLGTPNSPADIVLGVSFLRNVYTVHDLSPPSGDDDDGSNNSGMGTGDGSEAPRLGILPLTDISLAITEFHNIRILNRGPDGGSNLPSVATGAGKKSMSIIGKVMLGLGILVGVCVALFALRWFVLSRRFKKQGGRLSRWGTVSEAHRTAESVPMRERLDDLRRRGTRRFKQITDYGTPDGIEGDVATRSAIGHGSSLSRANSSRFTAAVHGQPESERPENARQPTGPWAGFSLATFIGAKRLGFGGGYTRTANPALGETVEDVPPVPPLPSLPDAGRQPSEDELRQRRFEEYYRRKTEERRFAGRGNEPSIWSDTTLIHRADIPLTPLDTPGTTGTITGSTTNLNLYGYPKVDENGILVREDDASTERSGSTLHGSPELPPKGAFAASATSLDRMVRDSREHLLLNPQASSSSLGGRQVDHTHRPVPSLDLERPPVARVDSSGIITSSPYPLTDSGPPTPSIPASSPGSLPTPETQGPIDQPSLMPFNPYNIPISIPPPATPPAVHSPRVRVAAEPTLSPLTEVTSQEQGSSRSDPSNLRRITPFGSVTPVSALSSDSSAERGGETDKLMRSTSIGALSMESEVLVPLPITLIERAKAKGEPVPVLSTKPRSTEGERGEEPWPAPFSKTIVPTPTKSETPRALAIHPEPYSFTSIAHLVASQSIPSVASTSTTPVQSQRTGKSFDAPEALDSRSPTLNVSSRNDSRFQLPSSPSAQPTPHLRPPNPHSASASPSRPAPVAMQEPVPLARSRLPDPTIPRPSEMHVDAGSEIFIPPRRFDEETGSGRSSSGSSAGMIANTRPIPASNRGASPPRIRERPTGSPFSDFMPPHEVRRPQEQQTLPAIGGARPRLPESAIASVGARHRGPRPITHKRTTSSDVSTSFASSPSSARRETGYGPLLAISTPSPASLGRSPGPYSASSDPISPPASSGTPYLHGAYPVNGFIEGELILPDATSSIANIPTEPQPLSSLPDTVDRTQDRGEYISGETLPANIGWREEAARTAGMAGLGARSKFMGNSLDYSPPSKQ